MIIDTDIENKEPGEATKRTEFKAIDTIFESRAVLVRSQASSNPEMVELIAARIRGVVSSRRNVLCQYTIERHRLPEAMGLTPSTRTPTIMSLDCEGWVAVKALVEKSAMARVMDDLKIAGAEDIMVLEIGNAR